MMHWFVMAISIKICGLTRPEDARLAVRLGAGYGGVIGHKASLRHVAIESTGSLLAEIPAGKRVRVGVEMPDAQIEAAFRAGFDWVQVHFDPDGEFDPAAVSRRFGPERLWFAPRLANPLDFSEKWTGLAAVFLIDGFSPDRMGGTGKRVNGESFAQLCQRHTDQAFTLAGGITPGNIDEVLRTSNASRIDISSGVESAPGIKDPGLLEDLFRRVRECH